MAFNSKILFNQALWGNLTFCTTISQKIIGKILPQNMIASLGLNAFTKFPSFNRFSARFLTIHSIDRPDPAKCKENLRYKVVYPEDGKYTIRKLPIIKLGGRDPDTGRIIYGCVGGGNKRKYRWVQDHRMPLDYESDTLVEKVIHIQYDPNRTPRIALVGRDTTLRYILATTSMKPGDLITSTRVLPSMPIRPKEGDAHPIGALPLRTNICCIEAYPGSGARFMINAGCTAVISRKIKDKIAVKMPDQREYVLDPRCIVVVGKVWEREGGKQPIGSPWRLRWLGRRPRSGLWQRKSGKHGRKIYDRKPIYMEKQKPEREIMILHADGQGPCMKVVPATLRVS